MTAATKQTILVVLLLAAAGVSRAPGQTNRQHEHPQSCKAFVQAFYDWYVPLANREDIKERTSNLALQDKKAAFTPKLYQALKADSDAQDRSPELVGLDFDPFLGGQDPDPRFELRKVKETGDHCSAEVWGIGDSEKRNHADTVAVLVHVRDGWRFMNFQYPAEKTNLLQTLQRLAADRRKSAQ